MARLSCGLSRLAAALAVGVLVASAVPAAARGPESVADIAGPLLDAVVNISTSQTVGGTSSAVPGPKLPQGSPFQQYFDEFSGNNGDNVPHRVQSLGSGFVIDPSGLIVTNNHVIEGADEITANFNDGTKLTATLVGHDDKTDLALLKVKADKPLTSVNFGDSGKMRVGDWVMAVGNPFGLGGTVTLGIVSARNRDINSGPYDNFIQTDASINRGNSGGPLFDMDGEVIGINTAIISPTGGSIGIGFAVPSEIAIGVVDQLRQFGETRRGWLGVRIQQVTEDVAQGLSMAGPPHGALVASVDAKSPAATGGIEAGDVILSFDGDKIGSMHDLPRIVASKPVGKQVTVHVLRNGKEQDVTVTLGRLEEVAKPTVAAATPGDTGGDNAPAPAPAPAPMVSTGPLGLTLSDLSPDTRSQFGIGETVTGGAVVTGVADGSPASDKRMEPGDVIIEINHEAVTAPEDITRVIDEMKTDGRKNALLAVQNKDGIQRWVVLPLDQ